MNEEIFYYALGAISYKTLVVHANEEVDSLVVRNSPRLNA
jgi:hypothetical protein